MTCLRRPNTPTEDSFYRLAEGHFCTYGDGGEDLLQYPIWVNKALKLNECRERLVEALDKLNEQRQDHHDDPSPVEDIIDPDLLICRPNQFDRDAWIEWRATEHSDLYDSWDERFETVEEKVAFKLNNDVTERVKLRSTYQWMPSEFVIDQNGHVTIKTAIPQLERIPENEQFYQDIATVFEAMLPAFQKTEIVGELATPGHTLQVIVKAQSYNLKADQYIFSFNQRKLF